MELDALSLARLQFAFTVSFHIFFPAFTIGLASYLAVLEGLWLYTGRNVFLALFNYWKKIFAVTFGMGVVSGIVMSYQFGTNWSVFSDKAGPVLGPLMGYEVLTAFFLEAGFLGVMLFGMERVGRQLHFFATLMVAAGTLMSAFWILAANSWMHTPAGYAVNAAGQFVATDWWAVIFNPSFPYRLVHMVLAAYLTTAFVVGAVGAFHLLSDRANEGARVMFSMAMWMAAIVAPIQAVAGDQHGLNTLEAPADQDRRHGGALGDGRGPGADPVRVARHEGGDDALQDRDPEARQLRPHPRLEWHGEGHEGLAGQRAAELAPHLLDLPHHGRDRHADDADGLLEPVAALASAPLTRARLLLRLALLMGPSGFVAVLAGWITTESGRQPYTVYGLLRTAESASPIDAAAVASSLVGLHRRLLPGIRRRHVLPAAPDAQAARSVGARHRDGRADARRRHHAGAGAGAVRGRTGRSMRH